MTDEQIIEIRQSKFIGKGAFGEVHYYNGKAVKLYVNPVFVNNYHPYTNPCYGRNHKIKMFMRKTKDIKNISHIEEMVKDGFGMIGVVYEYQEGETIDKIIDTSSFEEKINICTTLVDTSKALARKHIYPLDYKFNNALYDKEVTLIDLDDVHTKIKYFYHPLILRRSLYQLKRMIMDILEGDHYKISYKAEKMLGYYEDYYEYYKRIFWYYSNLYSFLKKRSQEENLLILKEQNLNENKITTLKELIDKEKLKTILITDNETSINHFEHVNLPIYDMYITDSKKDTDFKVNQCLNNFNVNSYYTSDNPKVKIFKNH